jgi:hypothetical protein
MRLGSGALLRCASGSRQPPLQPDHHTCPAPSTPLLLHPTHPPPCTTTHAHTHLERPLHALGLQCQVSAPPRVAQPRRYRARRRAQRVVQSHHQVVHLAPAGRAGQGESESPGAGGEVSHPHGRKARGGPGHRQERGGRRGKRTGREARRAQAMHGTQPLPSQTRSLQHSPSPRRCPPAHPPTWCGRSGSRPRSLSSSTMTASPNPNPAHGRSSPPNVPSSLS